MIASSKHRKDSTVIIGRKAFAKICAVEDIKLSAEAEAMFEDFDRRGLSHEERRRCIINRWRKRAKVLPVLLPR